ncbi:Hsp33 family molecular chaperone HslO [Swingsia samuiensis]|uniref:Hsp33 family molecular chaperone HslO n=1 Tax=Swingsia samuiensis TaxID=1293412 RepID=UPI0015E8DE5B|nr:Hsp33 family molecular chaperone HslO [Swingsia samuiensis]
MHTPPFLDTNRPDVPHTVIAGGIVPFHLEKSPVRGRLVRLGSLADDILSRHDNPDVVSLLGGEALSLVAAMASALKFQGSFSLQIKGDGPVSMLLADATDTGDLRFFARLSEDTNKATLPQSAKELLGNGYFAFTIDQGPEMDRHQGVVEITGETLSEMAVHYFKTSEQHDCWIKLFCQKTSTGWQAGALVLERIANEGGINLLDDSEDTWQTACTFAGTLQEKEIFDENLESNILIQRLFGSLDVIPGAPRALAFGCRCSRAKLASVLERFSSDDIDHMLEEDTITMNCEFCNVGFHFTRDELKDTAE